MRTKTTFNPIFMKVGICLLILGMPQIPSAFSNEESKISLEIAIETALRENSELNSCKRPIVGFILLFGIAVRTGIILVTHINTLRSEGMSLYDAVIKGAEERISPVLMTALTTGLGMLPLALAHGSGAELQKPLAIVISGGMITATLLTLLVLPVLYYIVELSWVASFQRRSEKL